MQRHDRESIRMTSTITIMDDSETLSMVPTLFPSIWLGQFDSFKAWQTRSVDLNHLNDVIDSIDDQLINSRHPFTVKAWCPVCTAVQPMLVTWALGGISSTGSVNPAWTETSICPSCGFNSRMRALFAFLTEHLETVSTAPIYLAEQVTPFYRKLKHRYPNLVGSEYIGQNTSPGTKTLLKGQIIRHEDITNLSFADASFYVIVTQDVFEHIADYKKAFLQCHRVLVPKGYMIFTIPFFPYQKDTETRATVSPSGTIQHHFTPEYHGNPVGEGSLCFHHFGWDILDSLRQVGFSKATAHLYWGPWQGHFGFPCFIFSAQS